MNKQLNLQGRYLKDQLTKLVAAKDKALKGQLINVAGVGSVVSAAYEQLRNAAEYTQEHLLSQGAIRRFYQRNLSFHKNPEVTKPLSEELVIELTQAGYIKNNCQPYEVLEKIQAAILKDYGNFERMINAGIAHNKAQNIALDLMSVNTEKIISDDSSLKSYLQFAFQHYKATLDRSMFLNASGKESDFDICLYVAIHKALLKSDLANVRSDVLDLYNFPDTDIKAYYSFHKNVDKYFVSELTEELTRYIKKYGAPLRVIKSMIEKNVHTPELLGDSQRFMRTYEAQINADYQAAKHKLNEGVIKSIVFLIITKGIISLAIEIPYDFIAAGAIAVLPLTINVLTPIIFMILVRIGLKMPGSTNTKALMAYVEDMLYSEETRITLLAKRRKPKYSFGFKIVYALMFLIVFGAVTVCLASWEFNVVQGVIFFIFLATASFLGFRLSHIVRDLELVTVRQGFFAAIRDFLCLPFILLGQWLSDKYQKINVTTLILDTIVELPLKTVLRLIRQWTGFINEKKDEI